MRSLRQEKKIWSSVKDLCLITGDDDLDDCLREAAADIVADMVPNLEGLHIETSTCST
jgi:hypothetical protein